MKYLRNLIESVVVVLLAGVILFLVASSIALIANADDFKWVQLETVNINYRQYLPNAVYPLITDSTLPDRWLDKGISIQADTDIMQYGYWHNLIHSETDKGPGRAGNFRTIGWKFELGLRLSDFFSIEYGHHSQHVLDIPSKGNHPYDDSIGINLILFSKTKRSGVFNIWD